MSKGFDFDIKKLEKAIRKDMKKAALDASYSFECPDCHTKFEAKVGKNICPQCGLKIDLEPDSSWSKL